MYHRCSNNLLKVMTFNINGYFSEREDRYHWVNRSDLAMAVIQKYAPDLLGCQEVQAGNLPLFNEYLSEYAVHLGAETVIQDDNEKAVYNPIFWKKSRFEKYSMGSFYLSQTPGKWSKSWDSMHVRCSNWLKLRCLGSGNEFICLNTHLDHHGQQARIEGSKIIVDKIKKLRTRTDLPVIITGDFNSRAWAPPGENVNTYSFPIIPHSLPSAGTVLSVYTDNGFRDTFLEAGHINSLDTNTYHDFYGESFPPVGLRLDWILFNSGSQKIHTKTHLIIHDAQPPRYPSDHYPVLAELLWE